MGCSLIPVLSGRFYRCTWRSPPSCAGHRSCLHYACPLLTNLRPYEVLTPLTYPSYLAIPMMKAALRLTLVSATATSLGCAPGSAGAAPDVSSHGAYPAISGMIRYPLDGGPQPGSVIRLSRNGSVYEYQENLVDRSRLLQNACRSNLLGLRDDRPLPSTTDNRGSRLGGDLDARWLNVEGARIRDLHLSLDTGRIVALASGTQAISDLLAELPRQEIEMLLRHARSGSAFVVTEVDRRPSATLDIRWQQSVDASTSQVVRATLGVGGNAEYVDSLTTRFRYSQPTNFAFRVVPLDTVQLVSSLERSRTTCPRVVAYYRDRDGDGFGAGEAKLDTVAPAGYVERAGDCYDNNTRARPGQNEWFVADRGDGSFDYNCNGRQERRWTQRGRCSEDNRSATPEGWWEMDPPAPGQEGEWLNDCDATWPSTRKETGRRRQEGR